MADVRATPDSSDARRHEARLALALDAAGLGSWEFNLKTGTLTASDRCKANHGLPPEASLSLERDIIGTVDPSHQQVVRDALARTMTEGVDLQIEVPNTWPDGTHHWLMLRGRKVDDEWLLGVSLDVTERRRMEEALRDSDRRKDDFMAVLGHELRNPLAPIIAAAKYLEMSGPPEPRLQRARETIVRQATQITRIVDDLMDIGRINAGKLRLQKSRVDVKDILLQAVETCAPMIERRRHTLTLSVSDEPVYVDADPGRIVQVMSNLINNAVKYMDEGGRISVSGTSVAGTAVMRVRDEGMGIEPAMLETIFQRFVQVGTSHYRAEGGLGIGLALVKAIVELHHGTVEAHSAGLGKGSEFIVKLPAAP